MRVEVGVRARRGVIALALLVMPACESAPNADDQSAASSSTAIAALPSDPDPSSDTLRLLAAELNSARRAASKVETMPEVTHPLARREILLHSALYHTAHESNVGDWTQHFVLEPVREENPPNIGIDSEEFRLRVLGALDDLGEPVAWVTETWRSKAIDHFPETGERATRLRISILSRDDDAGIVRGEVGDWTADVGASRQKVTCRWDGLSWQIERDGVRLVW